LFSIKHWSHFVSGGLVAKGQHVLQIATILGGLGGLTLVVVSVCTILCWEMGVGLVGEG
jgi:hypothetical protein